MKYHCDKYNTGRSPFNIKGKISIMHDQKLLNKYFSKSWCPSTSKYIYSGYAIADKISSEDVVIDVGCGTNPFKGHINNLIGIDPTDVGSDVVTTIEDFKPKVLYDVALCLGSINFGNETIITNQIEKVNDLLFPCARIFWRLNPGKHDHTDYNHHYIDDCNNIDFFPWTFELLNSYAVMHGFEQINCALDSNGDHVRLYAEWVRGFQPEP